MDPILLQKQVRDNSDELRTYLKDLSIWENEMKRKESTQTNDAVNVPAVRPKIEKLDIQKKKQTQIKPKEKIKGYDYKAWDKFDVDAECEKLDTDNQPETPTSESSNGNDTTEEYQKRLTMEATYEKERGNQFVKKQQWKEAITCYTQAIACDPKNPVYFANRALCHLKRKNFHSTEADCTSALQIDPNYIKALYRRAEARIGLKQYPEAVEDLEKVVHLEPNNAESQKLLKHIEKKLHNTQDKNAENILKYIPPKEKQEESQIQKNDRAIQSKPDKNLSKTTKSIEKINQNDKLEVKIPWPIRLESKPIKTIQKLPHLRSKIPLHNLKIIETHKLSDTIKYIDKPTTSGLQKNLAEQNNVDTVHVADLAHLHTEKTVENKKETTQIEVKVTERPVPKTFVQFINNWRSMKDNYEKYIYIKNIKPEELPKIFQESLESEILGEIINILAEKFIEYDSNPFFYLQYLTTVRRFSTLVMFMTPNDKKAVKVLMKYCALKGIPLPELMNVEQKFQV